jgi:hypothetical protein
MNDALRCVLVAWLLSACATTSTVQAPPSPEPSLSLPAPVAAPPPPPAPKKLRTEDTEAHRTAGSSMIPLPDGTLARLVAKGVSAVHPKVLLCLDETGAPRSIDFRESTGDPEGDAWIRSNISGWRYTPFVIDDRPVKVCFMVHFNYRFQRP